MRTGVDFAWGRPDPTILKATGYSFVCRYLSHDTTGKSLTHAEAATYVAEGIDIVCVFEDGAARAVQGYAAGAADAAFAQAQALACGAPADVKLYFAVDFDTAGSPQRTDPYFNGIASVIGFARTGVYGGIEVVHHQMSRGVKYGWQTYAWSGGQWEPRAQLRQVQNGIKAGGIDADRNETAWPYFGQWRHPGGPTLTHAQWVWLHDDFIPKHYIAQLRAHAWTVLTSNPVKAKAIVDRYAPANIK